MSTVTTNGHARKLSALWELPSDAQSEFDYVPVWAEGHGPTDVSRGSMGRQCQCGYFMCDELSSEASSTRFFEYRGSWYDSHEFVRIVGPGSTDSNPFILRVSEDSPLLRWGAAQTDSAFSAIVIRFPENDDDESIIVGSAAL